jgi:hypothetical protein
MKGAGGNVTFADLAPLTACTIVAFGSDGTKGTPPYLGDHFGEVVVVEGQRSFY